MEYIKLTDEEYMEDDAMPCEWYFEVDPKNNRIQARSIEIYSSGSGSCMTKDEYENMVIEIVPVPTVEELNNGIWSDMHHAVIISEEDFNELWDKFHR